MVEFTGVLLTWCVACTHLLTMKKSERNELVASFEELAKVSREAAAYFRAGGGGLVTLMSIRASLDKLCKQFGKLNKQIVWSEESTPDVQQENTTVMQRTTSVDAGVLYTGKDPEPSLLH